MGLIRYDTTNVSSSKKHEIPTISFQKRGIICLNKALQKLLKISIKDSVIIYQDDQLMQRWYISKADKNGFALRSIGRNGALCFYHRIFAKEMLKEMSVDINSAHQFRVTDEELPTENETIAYEILLK